MGFRALLAGLLFAWGMAAFAARVEIPLRVPLAALEQALAATLAASPHGANIVYRDGRCRLVRLQAPRLAAAEAGLRLTAEGSAALGVEVVGGCQEAATWRGMVLLTLVPELDAAGRLGVRVVDSRLAGPSPAVDFLWPLAKPEIHARVERWRFDLAPLRDTLVQVVRGSAPPGERAALERVLAGLRFLPPRVEPGAIAAGIALDVPAAWLAAPPAEPVTPLDPTELDALEAALRPWDAFLVHAIKQIARDAEGDALRQRLFTLLLDSRYRLSGIFAGEETVAGGDPLRALFADAWRELRAIVAEGHRTGALDPAWLRHVAFLDAGDALLVLDRAAPGLGLRVSVGGLRQLARSIGRPTATDPLAFDWAIDRELGELFGVEEPPAMPRVRSSMDFLIRSAHAARELDAWAPTHGELETYEARIAKLLSATSAAQLQHAKLAAPYRGIYAHLVPTTALIESCWRQYTVRGGKVTYVRSRAGSVGIMQINQRVWRGFYDIQRLRWDTAYNVHAGAQILLRYLRDYAIPYAERSGNPDHVPRAAYAVYNAGPRAAGRFEKREPHPREKRVDDRLWSLYQAFAAGGQADLHTCGVAKDG